MEGGTTYGLVVMVVVVLCSAKASTQQSRVSYAGWRVLEVGLTGRDVDGRPLLDLQQLDDTYNVQVLNQNRLRGVAEVALAPTMLVDLTQYLENLNVPYTTLIEDLSRLLEWDGPSLRADPVDKGSVTFDHFMKYDEIIAHLEELPVQHPDLVQLREVGRSVENRPLYLLTITSNEGSTSKKKPVIFIEGGIHAREWISPAAALNVVGHLLKSPTLTREVEWRIMPLVNPDGYAYTWTHDRLWRKNRAETKHGRCPGVDLNRNFGYHWGEKGTSSSPCSTVFRGPQAFSEPETSAERDVLLEELDRTEAFLSFHSYGQFLLHPWGYTSLVSRANVDRLTRVGNEMAGAIQKAAGVTYQVGSPAKILYPASGAADDWAAGVGKVPLVFTMELRDEGAAGFILPNDQIKPAVNDAWVAVEHLGKHVISRASVHIDTRLPLFPIWPRNKNKAPQEAEEEGSSLTEAHIRIETKEEEQQLSPGNPSSRQVPIRIQTKQEDHLSSRNPSLKQDHATSVREHMQTSRDSTLAQVLTRAQTIQVVRGTAHVAARGDGDHDHDSSSAEDSDECFGSVHGSRRSIDDSGESTER